MFLSRNHLSKILTPLIVIGLFFTVTNKVYISALPAVFILLSSVLMIFYGLKQLIFKNISKNNNYPSSQNYLIQLLNDPIALYTAIFYFISLVSVLSYFPQSLLDFNFYRYDGNFIISYAVFLFLPWFIYQGDIERLLLRFMIFSALVNIPFFIYFLGQDYIYYHHLFSATNAAGGFFSMLLAMALSYFFYYKKKPILIIVVLLAIFLFFTTSRGSMLGLLAGLVAWYSTDKRKLSWLPLLMLISVISIQAFLLMKYYPYYLDKVSYMDYQVERQQEYQDKKEENIYNRLINNWPKGWDGFTRSPILGYGFGAVNDQPYPHSYQVKGLFNLNQSSQKVFSDAHAHHSYLHILAEQGLLGLICLSLMWYQIWRFLKHQQQIPWIRNGLLIAFWTIIFTSFTEHRITTPATLLPYSLLFLLYFGWVNYHQQENLKKESQ